MVSSRFFGLNVTDHVVYYESLKRELKTKTDTCPFLPYSNRSWKEKKSGRGSVVRTCVADNAHDHCILGHGMFFV